MKKTLVATGAAIAASALVTLGTVSPAFAEVTVIAPIVTADTGSRNSTGYGAAVSNDGSLAAAGMEYGGVTIYDVASGTSTDISLSTLGSTDIGHITFSPDSAFLYVADYDNNEIDVVDVADGSIDRSISLNFAPWMLEASRDGAYLYASGYATGSYYQIDLSDDSVGAPLMSSSGYAYQSSMCLSADGATLYAPSYADEIDVITTSTMSSTPLTIPGASELYSCEWDNDGNLIVADYDNTLVFKLATDGTVLDSGSADDGTGYYVYAAIPSCDKIYTANYNIVADIPVFDLATLDQETSITVAETPGGDGFYGYNGDRSLDGSVIAISGYYSTDGLVVIKSCGSESTPALANTGVDMAGNGISLAVAGGMVIAGAIALVAIRRRNA
jgi:DNA-binding beta-propeller fold protein YncE